MDSVDYRIEKARLVEIENRCYTEGDMQGRDEIEEQIDWLDNQDIEGRE